MAPFRDRELHLPGPLQDANETERERELQVICRAPSGRAQQRPFGLGEGFSPSLGVDACLSGGGLTPSARGPYQIKQAPFQDRPCGTYLRQLLPVCLIFASTP